MDQKPEKSGPHSLFNSGDEDFYTKIYNEYWSKMTDRLVYKLGLSRPIAEDIANDIFLNLWKLKKNFETLEDLKAYLNKAAFNRLINHSKRRKPYLPADDEDLDELLSSDSHIFETLDNKLFIEALHEIIPTLPPQAGKAVSLSEVYGLTAKEIAHQMDISERMARKHIVLGRLKAWQILLAKGLILLILCVLLNFFKK